MPSRRPGRALRLPPAQWESVTFGQSRALRETLPGFIGAWTMRTKDGVIKAIAADEPMGKHLSVSFAPKPGSTLRYPTWDELVEARYMFMPDNIDVVMHLPPRAEYVNLHDTCFHLHEHPERDGARP
jgi:hypothetical protein